MTTADDIRPAADIAASMEELARRGGECLNDEWDGSPPNGQMWSRVSQYSKGGQDTVENLRVLCRSCNSAKGARTDGS